MSKNNIITFFLLVCFHAAAGGCLILSSGGVPTTLRGWIFFSLFAVYIVICAMIHGASLHWEEKSYWTVGKMEVEAYNLYQAEKIAARIRKKEERAPSY